MARRTRDDGDSPALLAVAAVQALLLLLGEHIGLRAQRFVPSQPPSPALPSEASMSDQPETPCPKSPDGHCDHWYDDSAPCCRCGDDGDHVHGDHHPSIDCRTCADRIADGRTTLGQIYALEAGRYSGSTTSDESSESRPQDL